MALLSQIIESLWGMGISEADLQNLPTEDVRRFRDELRRRGVNDEQYNRANALADWRYNDKHTPGQNARDLAVILGVDPKQIKGSTHQEVVASIAPLLSPQAVTNLAIKTKMPVPQGFPTWNPFRGDAAEHGVGAPSAPAAPPPAQRPGKVWSAVPKPGAGGVPPGGAPPGGFPPPGGGALPPGGVPPGGVTPLTTPVEKPLTPEERRERIESNYGWAAALGDDPEISKILADVANGTISETKADQLYKSSNFYKTYSVSAREWKIMERTDPVDAKRKRAENLGIILDLARTMGITEPDMGRMERLNDFVLSTGISDREVKRMLASEMRYDPEGTKTGISAQLKNISREWLVPLSDQAMTAWVQGVAGGTKSTEDFTEYLRGMAKSMFPALGTALDDPNMTTRTYMDPYAQDTAQLLGVNPADIDWMDPKYMRAFNQVDPKTNQRSVMSRSDWQRTLMKDPTYKYDETAHGKAQKQALTTGLMEMFGFKF